MRRSSSCELRRVGSSSKSNVREAVDSKWRVLLSPAALPIAAVSAVGLFMLVRSAVDMCILQVAVAHATANLPLSPTQAVHSPEAKPAVQINLCTLAMRQQQMLDIFNTPATSSSRLHITVRSAAGDEVKALPQPWQSFTMPHACSQGPLHHSTVRFCMARNMPPACPHPKSCMQRRIPSMDAHQLKVYHTGIQQRR